MSLNIVMNTVGRSAGKTFTNIYKRFLFPPVIYPLAAMLNVEFDNIANIINQFDPLLVLLQWI